MISEWLGGFEGLGVYMTRVKKAYAFDKMFAVIVFISVISLLLMALVAWRSGWQCPGQTKEQTKEQRKEKNKMNKAKKIFCRYAGRRHGAVLCRCSGGKTADKTDTTAAPAQKTDITVCLDWTPTPTTPVCS